MASDAVTVAGDVGEAEAAAVRAAALAWLAHPGSTRRTLAGRALVRPQQVTALLAGRGTGLPREALERIRATANEPPDASSR